MRRISILLSMLLVVACAPVQTYYRAGAPVAELRDDQLDCEVEALRDAPVAQQTRVSPPVYVPPRKECDASGNCISRGGLWLPGDTYTVDVNADLRGRVEERCMARKGYALTSIPQCPTGIAQAAPKRTTTVLPALDAQSCLIRYDSGAFQIVTQAP